MLRLVITAILLAVATAGPARAQLCYNPENWGAPPTPCAQQYRSEPVSRQATLPAKAYRLPSKYVPQRRLIEYEGIPTLAGLAVGDIYIDRTQRFLYIRISDAETMRYGIGVGRQGFGEKTVGEYYVGSKQQNPPWHPPAEMLQRQPYLPRMVAGGRPDNPLGVRAMYLRNKYDKVPHPHKREEKANEDSLFRIHGTNQPWSIGTAESSGCFRMTNEAVMDLYERVRAAKDAANATRVVVR